MESKEDGRRDFWGLYDLGERGGWVPMPPPCRELTFVIRTCLRWAREIPYERLNPLLFPLSNIA